MIDPCALSWDAVRAICAICAIVTITFGLGTIAVVIWAAIRR